MLRPRDIPNLISILRILLVVPVVVLLLDEQYQWALVLFFVAGASDGLDGFLARHFHWQSHLGGILDPLADKLLLVSVYLCLGWLGALPVLLVALVLLRDLVIVGGAVAYHLRVEKLEARPTLVSKLNTLMQILLVLAVMADLGVYRLPAGLVQGLIWAVAITTTLSGLDYVVSWGRKARRG